jgi:hypothetical protein
MGRTRALFEVQRYLTDVGWVAQSPSDGRPVWFRSLETARMELHTEMLRRPDSAKVGCQSWSPHDFDPAAYRITDGITVWKPEWNSDKTALSIRIDYEAGPARLVGRILKSSRSASRWQVSAPPADAPRKMEQPGLSDNGDSGRRRPSNQS